MSKHCVSATQQFNCPISILFNHFSDPYKVGQALDMPCTVLNLSNSQNPHGIGMTRRIKAAGLPNFDEVITEFEPNTYIAYKVFRGGIVKDHLGELTFSENPQGSCLHYQIQFSPRWPVPFLGSLIQYELQKTLTRGLAKSAQLLNS